MIERGRHSVLGTTIDAIDYDAAVGRIMDAARTGQTFSVAALAVHGVVVGVRDAARRAMLTDFEIVTPDGQPVRWALRWLHGVRLPDRVYGPALTRRVLDQCAAEGLPVYFYGSTEPVLRKLISTLERELPHLIVAGSQPSRFARVPVDEVPSICERISDSGARLAVVGLGCPRQEEFAHAVRPMLSIPVLAVGAAFDYHAGTLRRPPPVLQRMGLEWLWRLALEPSRLWRRYLILNPVFVVLLTLQRLGLFRPSTPRVGPSPTHVPV